MPHYCVAPGCRNLNGPECTLFSFPSDQNLNLEWRVNMNRGESSTERHLLWKSKTFSKLCQHHFTDDCFTISPQLASQIGFKQGRLRLKPDAIPTIFSEGRSKQVKSRGAFEKKRKQVILNETVSENQSTLQDELRVAETLSGPNFPETTHDQSACDPFTAVPIPFCCDNENVKAVQIPLEDSNKRPVKVESKSEIIETDGKLVEFSFFEAEDVSNQEQKKNNVEQDEEDVVDRIFAAAKGGNQKDLSKLIFSSHPKQKDNFEGENDIRKGISFPLKRKSTPEVFTNLSAKKVCVTREEKFASFKDIQNTFKPFSRVADETGRFVQLDLSKSPPVSKDTEPLTVAPVVSTPVTKTVVSNKQANIKTTVKPVLSNSIEKVSKKNGPKDSDSINTQANSKPPLIDIGVLTNAITSVLEECISKNEKSNIKLVLFCNDKPRHSFSILETLATCTDNKKLEDHKAGNSEIVADISDPSTKSRDKCDSGSVAAVLLSQAQNCNTNIPNFAEIHSIADDSKKSLGNVKEKDSSIVSIKSENKQKQECDLVEAVLGNKVGERTETVDKYHKKSRLESKKGKKQDTTNPKSTKNKRDTYSDRATDKELKKEETEETKANVNDEIGEGNLEIVENTETSSEENNNSDQPDGNIHVGFQCTECLKVFKSQRYLKIHRNNVHGLYDEIKEKEEPQHNTIPSLDQFLEERCGGTPSDTDNTEKDQVEITEVEDTVSDAEKEFINLLLNRDPLTAGDNSPIIDDSPQYKRQSKIVSLQNLASRECLGEQFEIEPVFVCEHCGKFYHSRKSIKDHFVREHSTEPGQEPLYIFIETNSYNCPICFKSFPNPYNLVAHAKTHTKDEELKCAVCGKVYSSVYVLRRHIDTIHSDIRPRPYKCRFCEYAAENRWHLREHQRRHTGEQPFQCPICLKNFSHQGTMNRHCKVTHKVIPGAPKRLFYPSASPDSELSHVSLPDKKLLKEEEQVHTVVKLSTPGKRSKIDLPFIPVGSADISKDVKFTKVLEAQNKGSGTVASYTETSIGDNAEQLNNTETEQVCESGTDISESNVNNTVLGPEGELVIIKQEPLDD